jgi:hypothetical protein
MEMSVKLIKQVHVVYVTTAPLLLKQLLQPPHPQTALAKRATTEMVAHATSAPIIPPALLEALVVKAQTKAAARA